MVPSAPFETHASGFFARRRVRARMAHDFQPGEVFRVSAWVKARRPAGPQPGVVAMCPSVRVGVGEGLVA